MNNKPDSLLTRQRPDLWQRGLALATSLTGYEYAAKRPLPDGTIYACGGGTYWDPAWGPFPGSAPKTPTQIRDEEIAKIEREIQERRDQLDRLKRSLSAPVVFVPEGAMEWLLHELGHWLATPAYERALPNYGITPDADEHEMRALAFEEIVMAPFGPARSFVPPTQRTGVVFDRSGPVPADALAKAERAIRDQRLDVEAYRALWGEWVTWGRGLGDRAPWIAAS